MYCLLLQCVTAADKKFILVAVDSDSLCICTQHWYAPSMRSEFFFFFQAEDGIRDSSVTGVQTCALPISAAGLAADDAPAGHDIDIFAENISLAMGNQRLRETLRSQSIRDPLTGLFNRR